jgi:hypothetical protein
MDPHRVRRDPAILLFGRRERRTDVLINVSAALGCLDRAALNTR